MPGDPALEPGDRVALPQADGTAPEMLVTHFVWHYHGRQTEKSVGRNPSHLTNNSDGTTEKLLRKVQNSREQTAGVLQFYEHGGADRAHSRGPGCVHRFAAVEDTSAMFLASCC